MCRLAAILLIPWLAVWGQQADAVEHFKYGSIGAEERAGIPYWVWKVLPDLFPQYLPTRSGLRYEKFGLVTEPGKDRPIGSSLRDRQNVPILGLNCAVCHTGTVREAPGGPRRVIPGMPSHQFDLQSYQQFFFAAL
ncbi:MAG: cytochrome c, partial [Acidobacteria bacterium]|nr:cytochrome c [Acidobacteriota bacterium]